MMYSSICVPAQFPEQIDSKGQTLNIIVDIEHNRIALTSEDKKNTIYLDLVCTEDFVQTLQGVVASREFRAALQKKITEHTGRIYAKDRTAS